MNKKILFVVPSFHNGGTISSLKNMLPWLVKQNCSIDVFAITNVGPNYNQIQKYANIIGIRLEEGNSAVPPKMALRKTIYKTLFLILKWVKKQLCQIGFDVSDLAFKSSVKKIQKNKYDIIIAFQEGQPTKYVSFFEGAKKIAWVHCDYSNMLELSKGKPQHDLYSKIDKIVCVSDYTKEVFTSILPETKNKTIAIYNLMDTMTIQKKAIEANGIDERFDCGWFCIVSLGRIDTVKRFSKIPVIAKQLLEQGCCFKWYILGGVANKEEYDLLLSNIANYQVGNNVILLGEKNNPYPYIKQADLMVCTSLSEACPYVIIESKVLGVPVVTTNFGSATEFITNGFDGYVEPIETIADKIGLIINNPTSYQVIKDNVMGFEYNNDLIIKKLEQILCL